MTRQTTSPGSWIELAHRARHQATDPESLLRRSLTRGRHESEIVYRRRSVTARALPTFLIIGAQKSGTTSLHEYLAEHPEVGSSSIKEVHYFSLHSHRPLEWYRAHFPPQGQYAQVFESTPYYLFHPGCPERVRRALPDVKLVLLLRDPADRAYSHHNHERAMGYETLHFTAAVDQEQQRLAGEEERLLADPLYRSFTHQHYSYAARGMYARQLKRWLEFFPREQMLILPSEDLFADPAQTLHRVQRWLGLSIHSPADLATHGARSYPSMGPQLRAELHSRFRASSAALLDLAGDVRFPWT